jgi:hypothetical protein
VLRAAQVGIEPEQELVLDDFIPRCSPAQEKRRKEESKKEKKMSENEKGARKEGKVERTFVPAQDGILHHAADSDPQHLVSDLVGVAAHLVGVAVLTSLCANKTIK